MIIIPVKDGESIDRALKKFKKKFNLENLLDPGILNLKVFYNRDEKYFLKGNQWRKKYSNPVLNQGIHWIDFINEVFGEIIEIKSLNFKKNTILIFDVQPVRIAYYRELAFGQEYYVRENCIKFINDIC